MRRFFPPLMLRSAGLMLALACLCVAVPDGAWAVTEKTTSSKTSAQKKAADKKASTKKSSAKKETAKKSTKKSSSKKPVSVGSAQKDLARVQDQIRASEKRIQLTREQRAQKEAELKQAEAEISELRSSVGEVQTDVQVREQKLHELRVERSERLLDRERQVVQIKSDLRLAQRQGGEDYYKLLLNQQEPQALSRLMKYYGFLQQARAERVAALNKTLARLEAIEQEEQDELARLKTLRGELQHKQTRLTVAQETRNKTIKVLSARIESEEEKIARLKRDQQNLQAVMDRLERVARESAEREARRRQEQAKQQQLEQEKRTRDAVAQGKPVPPPSKTPAPVWSAEPDYRPVPYSGRCPLPADGGIRSRFGTARAGGLRWNGIVIAAAPGSPVRAVRPGKVAYADYLRGYGYLVIVDHGRGLMSLYGQNDKLHKKAGDSVAGNEVIASVGSDDNSEAAGLYFEIRHRGRPSDPAAWCGFK